MNDYLDNVRGKLGGAVEALASGTGPLKQRLYDCYRDIGVLDPGQLADEYEGLAQDLEGLKNAFTWLPPSDKRPDLGTLYGTLNALDEDEAQTLARRVVSLHEDVCRELYTSEVSG
ncbi:MAG: hypothetical protein M3Q49_19455 [Actinomycetota bacterium]|nr:hypothetical protein [Actinomycetota bacterium]